MEKIDSAAYELREMDELAAKDSFVHSLHPLTKILVTIIYIFIVVSFDKYNLTGLFVMILFPIFMYELAGIPISTCFQKLKLIIPLVCAVGLLNPFFDKSPAINLSGFIITGGMISMLTLMMKGIFCLMASFLLAATTKMDAICAALRLIHVPNMLVTLLLLTYRYITVMMEEISIMTTAYKLRAPGQKGIHISAWGSFLGQLLLRSMDRADELYSSMLLRGFAGEFWYADVKKAKAADFIFVITAVLLLLFCRFYNIAALFGGLALGGV